jgi:hypothetical protein
VVGSRFFGAAILHASLALINNVKLGCDWCPCGWLEALPRFVSAFVVSTYRLRALQGLVDEMGLFLACHATGASANLVEKDNGAMIGHENIESSVAGDSYGTATNRIEHLCIHAIDSSV